MYDKIHYKFKKKKKEKKKNWCYWTWGVAEQNVEIQL